MSQGDNKRIAKNTIFLYFRMLLTMFISLFTSRVILQVLGVEDYGIYQTVGGFVALLSYINGSLSVGSSRFLTFELGRGDESKLKKTFSSVLTVHIFFAIFVVVLGETVGLWFLYNKLIIPEERMVAAFWAYQFSILASILTITQIPYSAVIISHEKMNIYAMTSIIESVLKLVIVYILTIMTYDKLIIYSLLILVVNAGIILFYRRYCTHTFAESRYSFSIDKSITKKILSYSGWNLFATTSVALCNQGVTILTNMFFNPSVVAARAIANQINSVANQFVVNFRTAVNPQIVKKYAADDFEGSKRLLLTSTKYSFFMMLVLALPISLVAEELLQLWLGQVPEYSVIFLQLAIWTSVIAVFDQSFYAGLYAKGQIKENSIFSCMCFIAAFVAVYILFKLGASPVSSGWALLIAQFVTSFIVKPFMLVKIVKYKWVDIFQLFYETIKVGTISIIAPLIVYYYFNKLQLNWVLTFIVLTTISVLSVSICVWIIGLDKDTRFKIISLVKSKFKNR